MDHRDGFLITLQSDYLLAVRPSMNVEPAAYFDIPETVPSGIDVFAANPHGDLYARTLWHREVVELPHASGFSKSARIATADEGTAVMALAWSSQLDGLLIGDSAGRIQLWRRGGETETWRYSHLYLLLSIQRPKLFIFCQAEDAFVVMVALTGQIAPSR